MAHLQSRLFSTVLAALGFLAGCAEPPSGLHVGDSAQLQKIGRPVFGHPIALRGTNSLMIPFAVEMPEGKDTGFAIGSISGGSYFVSGSSAASGWDRGSSSEYFSGSDRLRWNNATFFEPASAKSRLLLDHPALICRFYANSDKGPVRGDYLLFGIAENDSNHDGVIGPDDAVRLYRTDAGGNGLLAITPADTQLLDLTSFDGQWIYLRVRRDSDGDGEFTDKDLIDLFRADPKQWADPKSWKEPEKLIPDDLRSRAFDAATKRP